METAVKESVDNVREENEPNDQTNKKYCPECTVLAKVLTKKSDDKNEISKGLSKSINMKIFNKASDNDTVSVHDVRGNINESFVNEPNDNTSLSFDNQSLKSSKIATSAIDSFKTLLINKMFVSFAIATTFSNVSLNVYLYLLVDIFRDKGFTSDNSSLALLLINLASLLGHFSSGGLTVIPHITVLGIAIIGSCVWAISQIAMIYTKLLTLTIFVSCIYGVCYGIIRAQLTVGISRLLDFQHLSVGMGVLFTFYGCINTLVGPVSGKYSLIF